jgi:hypothetical protein
MDGAVRTIGLFAGPRHERNSHPNLEVILVDTAITNVFSGNENIFAVIAAYEAEAPLYVPETQSTHGARSGMTAFAL